ncbi:MAG: PAS domain-containing protein [Parvibaculum sp.]|uniref:PAS domain-containing protein n=1 Tax=Parvibaculum sp. TaxID=2024848 RepID=UPI00391A1047
MRIEANQTIEPDERPVPARSPKSLAFQKAWEAIPKEGLIPDKSSFRPERFAQFLNSIFLVELSSDPARRIVFRIVGQTIRDALGRELRGMSYSDFVPEEHRSQAGSSMQLMFGPRPCGRWVGKEVVHLDGYREPVEMTQLPMTDNATGARLVIGIVEGFGTPEPHSADGKFRFESRNGEYFFDIGAGVPD